MKYNVRVALIPKRLILIMIIAVIEWKRKYFQSKHRRGGKPEKRGCASSKIKEKAWGLGALSGAKTLQRCF